MPPSKALIPVTCYTFSGLSADYKEAYYQQEGAINGRRVTVLRHPDFKDYLPPRRVTETALSAMQRDLEGSVKRHRPDLYTFNKYFQGQDIWTQKGLRTYRYPDRSFPEEIYFLDRIQNLTVNSRASIFLSARWSRYGALHPRENELSSLPESIGKLRNLEELFLGGNRLDNLPDSLGNCRSLDFVDLDHNFFTTIPEVLYHLPETCTVYLQGNPLFPAAIEAAMRRMSAQGYAGPRMQFSVEESVEREALPLQDALPQWDKETNYTDFLLSLEDSEKATLSLYLSRLQDTKDYQVNSESQKEMKADTQEFLRWLAELSGDNKAVAFVLLDEANAACADRIAQYRNDLFALRCLSTAGNMRPKDLKELLVGLKKIDLLREISKQKCKSLRAVDEVEVYLYYTTHLRESLDLPTRSQSMLYPKLAQVTRYDLEVAEKTIHALTTGKEQEIPILIESLHWRKLLEKDPSFKVAAEACKKLEHEEKPTDEKVIEKDYQALKKKEATTWNPYYVLTEKLFYKNSVNKKNIKI